MNLSAHFTLEELTFSSTAARLGIDNAAAPDEVEKLRWLASQLEGVHTLLGPLHVDSGLRHLELNRALGSKDSSQHVKCEAADLKSLLGAHPIDMCNKVIASDIPFDQVIYEFDSWMHISFVPDGQVPRRQALTINHAGTKLGIGD